MAIVETYQTTESILDALSYLSPKIVWEHVESSLQQNPQIIYVFLKKDPSIFNDLAYTLKTNHSFLLSALDIQPKIFKFIDSSSLSEDLVCKALSKDVDNIYYVSTEYRQRPQVFISALRSISYHSLDITSLFKVDDFLKDRDVALLCLKSCYKGLKLIASSPFKSDPQFIYEAAWRFHISELDVLDIKIDKKIKFLQRHSRFINDDNWPIILKAIQTNPKDFFHPPELFKSLTNRQVDLVSLAHWAIGNKVEITPINMDCDFIL